MEIWDRLISLFELSPHPEGGHYKRTYCSSENVQQDALPSYYSSSHPISSAILFLLKSGEYSCLHRIHQDECWHFYHGSPLRLVMLSPSSESQIICKEIILGNDYLNGQYPQFVIPGGWWFGATPLYTHSFSFIGCTVAPAFMFEDWELANSQKLKNDYPRQYHKIIDEFVKA